MPTLIHVSDLHRSPEEPIDNDTLLAAITADIDRFALLNERPKALIVSGDLVQGVRMGAVGFENEMRTQYEVAFDFIGRLCDEILDGDRSRVVIVPGNHDICWNTSNAAMETVADDRYPSDLRSSLGQRDGQLRWSWKERRLYKVSEATVYNRRLAAYWDALESFYRSVTLPLPIDRSRGFHMFSLFDGRVLVAAFESTHRNDHLRYEAELSTGVVSRFALHLRKSGLTPSLLAAVWHHSVNGAPNREDYLNIEAVREMAGLGFQIGFHGHQHLADSTDLSVSIGGGATMCVVSAGSLCAGGRELPRGTDRQYNIVQIEPTFDGGTLHIREMAEGSQFTPRVRGRFLEGKVPLSWSSRPTISGQPTAGSDRQLHEYAVTVEEANRRGKTSMATKELLRLNPAPGTYPRTVLLQALKIQEDWPTIWAMFWPSVEVNEIVMAAEAAFQMEDLEKLETVIATGRLPVAHRDDFEARRNMLKLRKGK